jgi:hypothetical protein
MLHREFRGFPGEFFVAQNLYHIIDERYPLRLLTSPNWEGTARPGMKLKISLILSHLFARRGQCPRCKSSSFQNSYFEQQGMMTWYGSRL